MNPKIDKESANLYIRNRNFSKLFVELGWDADVPRELLQLETRDNEKIHVKRIVEKRGFVVCVCDEENNYPATCSDRRRLVNQLARSHYEHLLILCGKEKQCWTIAIRPKNRPLRTVEVEWNESQDIQFLLEKLYGMVFDISEEDGLSITDVVERVRSVFMENAEKVTRRFYGEFKEELKAFSGFIEGIRDQVSTEWYAALMLNRLMFIYFIQKKRFLDGDVKYLETRLDKTQSKYGKGKFHDRFYRHFLRQLFAEGLGKPESARDPELKNLLGRIPYLNGGLFDIHEIEEQNKNINIKDEAFEKLFAFFSQYQWHLDTRSTATGKDINPDVIGYIFEKYINDRAAMGAYYTQEDITGYITRNTVIPFLLHRTKEKCKNAFDSENGIWRFLRKKPDDYIYDAVKKGCDIPDKEIPDNIRCGMDTQAPGLIKRRKEWNTTTEERFALPTEIWRETLARRQRYFELKAKMENGDICEIDDLITYNLDIERFASDALRYYEGSDFIAAFFKAIAGQKALRSNQKEQRGITILDPACGSGAFLFAALNVLEPLYDQCIQRMEDFVDEDDRLHEAGKRKGTKKHPQFREFLNEISEHPNRSYWIYKTIILNNLYGVDLMKEASEIAKLRLFLKLAAEAEYNPDKNNLGLEPLPDIDFNIRSGNSLVGFSNMKQFEVAVSTDPQTGQGRLPPDGLIGKIREKAREVQNANEAFIEAQDKGSEGYQTAKQNLKHRLRELNDGMNRHLAEQYGKQKDSDYQHWLQSHQPFHWLAEFYGIIEESEGFDVVVGNPPYVGYRKVRENYTIQNYLTESCDDLYAFFMERSKFLVNRKSSFGMIVPISLASSKKMQALRDLYASENLYLSNFADRPSCLFTGVHQTLNILITTINNRSKKFKFSSGFHHWKKEERGTIFSLFDYNKAPMIENDTWPKINDSIETKILSKIEQQKTTLPAYFQQHGEPIVVCGGTGGYWLRIFDEAVSSNEYKNYFSKEGLAVMLCAVLNLTLFYWFWRKYSNSRHLNKKEMDKFKFDLPHKKNSLRKAGEKHLQALKKTKRWRDGDLSYEQYRPAKAKKEVDKIDSLLSIHYGLTEEELDYIINYDIKYRIGLTEISNQTIKSMT